MGDEALKRHLELRLRPHGPSSWAEALAYEVTRHWAAWWWCLAGGSGWFISHLSRWLSEVGFLPAREVNWMLFSRWVEVPKLL